jgi:hypothetical protein
VPSLNIGISASSVFTPLDLSPLMWFDAADSNTITSSGSPAKVSKWSDKSGNNYHAEQATSANQPTTAANTQNGLNVLTFSVAGPNWLKTPSGFNPSTNGLTFFSVTNVDSTDIAKTYLSQEDLGGTGRSLLTSTIEEKYESFLGGVTLTLPSVQTLTTLIRLSCPSGSNQTSTLSSNGGAETVSTTVTINSTTGSIVIGTNKNKEFGYNGYIAELIIFNKVLSATEISLIETYLNKKWVIY